MTRFISRTMTILLLILLGFLLAKKTSHQLSHQLSHHYEHRVICAEFSTPWSKRAGNQGDIIYWTDNSKSYRRKMLPGEICSIEKRHD